LKDLFTLGPTQASDVEEEQKDDLSSDLKQIFGAGVMKTKEDFPGIDGGISFFLLLLLHHLYHSVQNDEPQSEDNKILSVLFDSSQLTAAISHEKVLERGGEVMSARQKALEKEANKIAKDAVETMNKHRKSLNKENPLETTWTGSRGAAGAPDTRTTVCNIFLLF